MEARPQPYPRFHPVGANDHGRRDFPVTSSLNDDAPHRAIFHQEVPGRRLDRQLGSGLDGFLGRFGQVCENVNRHLKPGGYVGLVIGDIWHNAQVEPLGFMCMQKLCDNIEGARLKSIVVKDIKNNRHNAGRRNLMLSRLAKWGGVEFKHEYIFSVQKGR